MTQALCFGPYLHSVANRHWLLLLQQGLSRAAPASGAWAWWSSANPGIPPGPSLAVDTWEVVLREKIEGQGAHKEPQRAEKCLCSPGNRAQFFLIVAKVKANSFKARREHRLRKQNIVWNDLLGIQSSQRNIPEEMGAGEAQGSFFRSDP